MTNFFFAFFSFFIPNHFCLIAIAASDAGVTAEEEEPEVEVVVEPETELVLLGWLPAELPFVTEAFSRIFSDAATDFLLFALVSCCCCCCDFCLELFVEFEAAEGVFWLLLFRLLFEDWRLDSNFSELGTLGGALVSPLLPLEQVMEGGEEGVAFGVDEPVEELTFSWLFP